MAEQLTKDEITFLYQRDPHKLDELRKAGLCDLALGIRTQTDIDLDNAVQAATEAIETKEHQNGSA